MMQSIVPPVVYKTLTKDYGFKISQIPSLAGKTVVMTGGTNGIGLSVARALYASNVSRLILLSSTEKTANSAIKYIKSGDLSLAPTDFKDGFGSSKPEEKDGGGGEIVWKKCSLEDLNEVKKVSEEIKSQEERLDLLLGIAGIGVNEFEATEEGYDKHLVINNLSHVLLANRLLPLMRKTTQLEGADVRAIFMSSELHRATMGGPSPLVGGGKFASKSEFKEELGPNNLYARTKLATLLFVKGLMSHTSLNSAPIRVYATHPGAVSTGQQDQFKPAYGEIPGKIMGAAVSWAMRNPQNGAMSVLWSATSADAAKGGEYENGTYFTDPNELGKESSESDDKELIDNFWSNSQLIIKEVAGADSLLDWEAKL